MCVHELGAAGDVMSLPAFLSACTVLYYIAVTTRVLRFNLCIYICWSNCRASSFNIKFLFFSTSVLVVFAAAVVVVV